MGAGVGGMARFVLSLLILWVFNGTQRIEAQPAAPQKPHRLVIGSGVHQRLYDDPEISYTSFRPFVRYQFNSPVYRVSVFTGGVLNRIDASLSFSKHFALIAGGMGNFIFFGDKPRINGMELSTLEFNGHRFGPYLGFNLRNPREGFPLQLRVFYDFELTKFYSEPSNRSFSMPKNFQEHGIVGRIDVGGEAGGFELNDLSPIRTSLYTTFKQRVGNDAWGDSTFLRDVDRYFGFSASAAVNWEFDPRWVAVLRVQGSSLSKVDRLNALRDAALAQEHLGLGLSDVKAERGATGDVGVRYYLTSDRRFAIRPFGHMVTYREITPTGFRRDTGAGFGAKLAGKAWDSLEWEVSYANLFGTRGDIHAIHDARAFVRYAFGW